MPQFDNRKAASVWQRVHAAAPSPADDAGQILALIPDLQLCARLCAQTPALRGAFLTQLNALRGIYTLLTGQTPTPLPRSKSGPLSDAALRRCCAVQLRCLSAYRALCVREDFGPAFRELISLGQNALVTILAHLGA